MANAVYDIAPCTCSPITAVVMSPVPLKGTYVVFMPKTAFRRSCAMWFAELSPEPPRLSLPGSAFATRTKSWKDLMELDSATTSGTP